VSLNVSQVFVRYPDVKDAAEAVEGWLAARLAAGGDVVRHVCVPTGSAWIGLYAAGNTSPPELAEHVSRALEAHATWFGLSARALAFRHRRYHLGRMTDDSLVPQELFGTGDDFKLPAYSDVEQGLFDRLKKEIPEPYLFAFAEEFGASARGEPDAVVVAPAPWSERGVGREPFAHRLAKRPAGVRTLWDEFDEEAKTVTDAVVLRGTYDEGRATSLVQLLQKLVVRRTVPDGWSARFRPESPTGATLVEPVVALHAAKRTALRLSYDLVP
jgi:hypothetical protein